MLDFTDKHAVTKALYAADPSTFEDKVDGTCTMPFEQAETDDPKKVVKVKQFAEEITASSHPQISFLGHLGKKALLDEIAEFTWFWGPEFFVETEFGNFIWKDPDYDGDNTFTWYDGDIAKFCTETGVEHGRSKGRHVIGRYCGKNIVLEIPDPQRT